MWLFDRWRNFKIHSWVDYVAVWKMQLQYLVSWTKQITEYVLKLAETPLGTFSLVYLVGLFLCGLLAPLSSKFNRQLHCCRAGIRFSNVFTIWRGKNSQGSKEGSVLLTWNLLDLNWIEEISICENVYMYPKLCFAFKEFMISTILIKLKKIILCSWMNIIFYIL